MHDTCERNAMQIIPPKMKGKNIDLSEKTETGSQEEAIELFRAARFSLLHPERWYELCDEFGGQFTNFRNGATTKDEIRLHDYIRIDIPGPDNKEGDGYDWVQVDRISDEEASIGMTLVSCASPIKDDNTSSHFFKEGASSSFIIEMKGKDVEASYHGRNETINNETGNLGDNIRNTFIAIGAMLGLSEKQWSKLLKGFLGK